MSKENSSIHDLQLESDTLINDSSVDSKEISITGFIHHIRPYPKQTFIILRQGLSTLQAILPGSHQEYLTLKSIPPESFVRVTGTLSPAKINSCTIKNLELHITNLEIVTQSLGLPFTPRDLSNKQIQTSFQKCLDNKPILLRTFPSQSIFKLASKTMNYFRNYLRDFTEIKTPKLIPSKSEGGANCFEVNFFGRKAYLAQSPQLYKQMCVIGGLERVFEIGHVYRAEESNVNRYLSEFVGVDIEMEIENFETLVEFVYGMIVYVIERIYEEDSEMVSIIEEEMNRTFVESDSSNLNEKIDKLSIDADDKSEKNNMKNVLNKEMTRDGNGSNDLPNKEINKIPENDKNTTNKEINTDGNGSNDLPNKEIHTNENDKNTTNKEITRDGNGSGDLPNKEIHTNENDKNKEMRSDGNEAGKLANKKKKEKKKKVNKEDKIEKIERLKFSKKPTILTYTEGINLLLSINFPISHGQDLNREAEKKLGSLVKEKYNTDVFIVTKYPKEVRAFYTESVDEFSNSFDIIMRGEEILSGAERIRDYQKLIESVKANGIDENTLSSYLESFKFGVPRHGGCGIGFERFLKSFFGSRDIRWFNLFPRDQNRITP